MQNKKILEAIEHLKKGGVIIYPTETAYGLGCDATNQEAVDLVFKIKQRSKDLILPVIVGSLEMAEEWVILSNKAKELSLKYWPGALTLVVQVKKVLASGCVAKDGTAAVRVSGNEIARNLSQKLGKPIVATSANLSGQGESYSVEELKNSLVGIEKNNIYIIDGGVLSHHQPTTIVKITEDNQVKILRQGEIKIDA
ncbi:MAG: L-threonylcarbamoyladenylate synthase [Candidatus Magasanikbacteria bacterium]|nr:L-threonylcarbamoyladenylate synthase [Candidatus Magasanikbacteria bacterium]